MTQDVVVYVVDDDESARDSMRLLLMTVGLEATAYESPVDFIERFDPHRPGCVILDLRMPELNGLETLIQLRERSKTVPVIFVTGHGDLSTVVRAMKLGIVARSPTAPVTPAGGPYAANRRTAATPARSSLTKLPTVWTSPSVHLSAISSMRSPWTPRPSSVVARPSDR